MASEYARRRKRRQKRLFFAVWFALVVVLFRVFGITSLHVNSRVLAPQILPGDRLVAVPAMNPERGDIALVENPLFVNPGWISFLTSRFRRHNLADAEGQPTSRYMVIRILAVGGDTVIITPQGLKVRRGDSSESTDTYSLPEPIDSGVGTGQRQIRLSDGTIFVGAGDGSFLDSRFYGPVPAASIVSIVRFRFWPIDRIGTP